MKILNSFKRLTKFEIMLWLASLTAVMLSALSGKLSALSVTASMIGVTALIFVARGDVLGQFLTLLFSVLYAVVSFKQHYYGEMITYLGMTAPMAALSAVSWLRHPYKRGENEVRVARLSKKQIALMTVLTAAVTVLFYFVLRLLKNASLAVSTVSVTTSFLASYLTFCRSYWYALAYAANDIVLIVLWIISSIADPAYISMVICFTMFFFNDIYGFINWQRLYKRQNAD